MAFSYYKSMTLDHTQAGTADTSNWPLTIGLGVGPQAADADLKTVGNGGFVQSSSGYDIRPYSDSALTTALTYELVYYDGTNGKLEMHVNVPTLSHTADTVIYLAFGDSGISTDGSSNTTWDSNYLGVYHFGTTTLATTDSSQAANNLTNHSATGTTGQIGEGAAFSGTSQWMVTGANMTVGSKTMTIEGWINRTAGETGMNFVYSDIYFANTNSWYYYKGFQFEARNNSGTINNVTLNTAIPTGAWHHVVVTYDRTVGTAKVPTIYLDGTAQSTTAGSSGDISATNFDNALFYIASRNGQDLFSAMSADEVRVSNNLRSTSWITASYNAQKSSSTFITWGAKTAVGGGGVVNPFNGTQLFQLTGVGI